MLKVASAWQKTRKKWKQELPHKMIMSKMEHQIAPANSDKHSGPGCSKHGYAIQWVNLYAVDSAVVS